MEKNIIRKKIERAIPPTAKARGSPCPYMMKDFEGEVNDYIIKAPDCQQDLIDEGQMQSNCVGSYIDKVINGTSMVFFMRKKKTPDQSLVTIEVRNNELAQVKARFNKQPSDTEMDAVNTWFGKMFHHEKAALMAA